MNSVNTIEARRLVLRLAAETPCDPRTAQRAILRGARAIRPLVVRDRIERAAIVLGITLAHGDDGDGNG